MRLESRTHLPFNLITIKINNFLEFIKDNTSYRYSSHFLGKDPKLAITLSSITENIFCDDVYN